MSTATVQEETHESRVFFIKAMEMVNRSNFDAAIRHLEDALQISPNNAEYLSHYGLCVAMEREDFDAAIRLCERAVKIQPKDTVSQVNLGKVHRLRGDNAAAYHSLLRAWKFDKTHPAPATELSRMGIRRPPVLTFLGRGHWLNIRLGMIRTRLNRGL